MSFFKNLLKIVAIIIAIIAIVYLFAALAIYAGVLSVGSVSFLTLGGILTLASWSSFLLVGLALLTLAYVISYDGANVVVRAVGDALGNIATAAGSVLGGIVTGVVGGGLSALGAGGLGTALIVAGIGIVAWKLLSKKKNGDGDTKVEISTQPYTRGDDLAIP